MSLGGGDVMVLGPVAVDPTGSTSVWVPTAFRAKVLGLISVMTTAVTVGDGVLTVEIGGTPITGMSLTAAVSGAAIGVVDRSTAGTATTKDAAGGHVDANGVIEIVPDGGATAGALDVYVILGAQDR